MRRNMDQLQAQYDGLLDKKVIIIAKGNTKKKSKSPVCMYSSGIGWGGKGVGRPLCVMMRVLLLLAGAMEINGTVREAVLVFG